MYLYLDNKMADQEETPTTGTTEEAPAPKEGGDEAQAPDAEKAPTPEAAGGDAAGGEQQADAETTETTEKTEETGEEKQPEPTEETAEGGEQKQEEGGEPDDKNANATEEPKEEATEGQEKGETEEVEQGKEQADGEGEATKEEEKKEGEGEAGETEEKKEEGEQGTEGEGQTAEVEGQEGEKQDAEGEGEKQEVEGEQKEEEAKEETEVKEEETEVPKSPVPQSDTFGEGERAESPVGVGQKLSRPGSPEGEVQVPVPDILEPGTPERSRPGSAEEDREEGKQLAPFEEEEEEEEDEEEEEQPEFDREELIERYHQAIAEREQLQQQNYQLQHKLADYFRKKKADEKQEYDKNVTDQEQRYLKYMAQLEDLRRQDMQERDNYKHQIEELKSRCEERKQKVDEERQKFMEFKKQVAQNAMNSRSGRPIPPKDIEGYLASENRKESEVVNVRLENIKLKNKLKKKEHQLKSKEELAEGLHLIDFEQLKIENQTYNEKIEERNEELLKLRKKITSTVQVLTHLKEKLQFVQAENQVQKRNLREVEAEVAQKRDILSRTKQARDALRIDNNRLRQNSGLLGNEPLLRDFEERKDEGDDLRTKLERLKMQHAELTLHCNQVRRKIEQARNGRA